MRTYSLFTSQSISGVRSWLQTFIPVELCEKVEINLPWGFSELRILILTDMINMI